MTITMTNTDPEARIEQMVQELAYDRVKQSYLFNALTRAAVDRKADELAVRISSLIETWIIDEVNKAAEQAI